MSDRQLLKRITRNPDVLGGKPIIRGTRLSVEYILHLLASGSSSDEVLQEYRSLTQDDLRACLLFAAESAASH